MSNHDTPFTAAGQQQQGNPDHKKPDQQQQQGHPDQERTKQRPGQDPQNPNRQQG